MARIHPKTWDDGVMPLDEFPADHRERILRAVERPTPPPRWLELALCRIESRAWYEWHWARGKKLYRIEGERRPRTKFTPAFRGAIYARDGFACLHCGARDNLTLDHIHPWSLGGSDEPGNLQTLCRPCNSRKGARV